MEIQNTYIPNNVWQLFTLSFKFCSGTSTSKDAPPKGWALFDSDKLPTEVLALLERRFVVAGCP